MEYVYGIEPAFAVADLHETIVEPNPIRLALPELEPLYPGITKRATTPMKLGLPWKIETQLAYQSLVDLGVNVNNLNHAVANVFDKVRYIEPVKESIESMKNLRTLYVPTGGYDFATKVLKAFFLDKITDADVIPITTKLVEDKKGVLRHGPVYLADENVRELFVEMCKPNGPTIFIGDNCSENEKPANVADAAMTFDNKMKGYKRISETRWVGEYSSAPDMMKEIRTKVPYAVGIEEYGENMYGRNPGKISKDTMSSFFNFQNGYKLISEKNVSKVVA